MSKCAENFQQKCKAFFDKANENGDGITVGALARVIREANPNFKGSDQEIAQMFFDIDDNSDQLITWEEFSDALFKRNPKEVTRNELEETFKNLDTDGSGKLDKAEVRRLMESLGINLSDEGLDACLDAVDPDDNGVDFTEFLAAWAGGK